MPFVKKSKLNKGNQKESHVTCEKLTCTLLFKKLTASHGQKPMKSYHSNTRQSTITIIIHYRKSQTGMIASSVNSSASVPLSVISSIKQELCFINPLRQLHMFVKNL